MKLFFSSLFIIVLFSTSYAETINPLIIAEIDLDCLDKHSREECEQQAERRDNVRAKCAQDPEWCQQYQNRHKQQLDSHQQWCKDNPEECKVWRDKRQAIHARCLQNPKACGEQYRQNYQQQKKAQEDWCTNNPVRCVQWEADVKTLKKQCNAMEEELALKYPGLPR